MATLDPFFFLHWKCQQLIMIRIDTYCGSLNVIGSHNLIGSGTIRRCGFVGVGMTLLEEMCHCGDRL